MSTPVNEDSSSKIEILQSATEKSAFNLRSLFAATFFVWLQRSRGS